MDVRQLIQLKIRGISSIIELLCREDINANLYLKWSKEFLEADKNRLARDTKRDATSGEVHYLKKEKSESESKKNQLKLLLKDTFQQHNYG